MMTLKFFFDVVALADGSRTIYHINAKMTIKKMTETAQSASQFSNRPRTNFSQSKALRKMTMMPMNINTMKNFIQPGNSSSVNCLLPKNDPTSSRKEMLNINNKTISAITSLMTAT